MISVAVRVEHGGDLSLAARLPVERQRRRRALGRDERVNDDHALVAFDQRHVRDVVAAYLVDAFGDLKEAGVHVQPCQPPERRVNARGCFGRLAKEVVLAKAPDNATVGVGDLQIAWCRGDQPARRIRCVASVVGRERSQRLGVALNCRIRWFERVNH